MLLGIEILTEAAAAAAPAGAGRDAPNEHPTLPPPTGRIDWAQMASARPLARRAAPRRLRVVVDAVQSSCAAPSRLAGRQSALRAARSGYA